MAFPLLALLLATLGCATPPAEAPTASVETAAAHATSADEVTRTDAEWRATLTPEEYRILRKKGTERAFTGKYWDNHEHGVYRCAGCGALLFTSEDKFESGTGWPSYTRPAEGGRVTTEVDRSWGMVRTEVLCARCGGHLGHVFDDGPRPTGKRYCINGNALDFEPATADATE